MNPRKFSEKIALHTQKQAEETAAFEKIMKEDANTDNMLDLATQSSQLYGGSLPNVNKPIIMQNDIISANSSAFIDQRPEIYNNLSYLNQVSPQNFNYTQHKSVNRNINAFENNNINTPNNNNKPKYGHLRNGNAGMRINDQYQIKHPAQTAADQSILSMRLNSKNHKTSPRHNINYTNSRKNNANQGSCHIRSISSTKRYIGENQISNVNDHAPHHSVRARSTHNERKVAKMDCSPYTMPYLSPPSPDYPWRRTHSDSALNAQSEDGTQTSYYYSASPNKRHQKQAYQQQHQPLTPPNLHFYQYSPPNLTVKHQGGLTSVIQQSSPLTVQSGTMDFEDSSNINNNNLDFDIDKQSSFNATRLHNLSSAHYTTNNESGTVLTSKNDVLYNNVNMNQSGQPNVQYVGTDPNITTANGKTIYQQQQNIDYCQQNTLIDYHKIHQMPYSLQTTVYNAKSPNHMGISSVPTFYHTNVSHHRPMINNYEPNSVKINNENDSNNLTSNPSQPKLHTLKRKKSHHYLEADELFTTDESIVNGTPNYQLTRYKSTGCMVLEPNNLLLSAALNGTLNHNTPNVSQIANDRDLALRYKEHFRPYPSNNDNHSTGHNKNRRRGSGVKINFKPFQNLACDFFHDNDLYSMSSLTPNSSMYENHDEHLNFDNNRLNDKINVNSLDKRHPNSHAQQQNKKSDRHYQNMEHCQLITSSTMVIKSANVQTMSPSYKYYMSQIHRNKLKSQQETQLNNMGPDINISAYRNPSDYYSASPTESLYQSSSKYPSPGNAIHPLSPQSTGYNHSPNINYLPSTTSVQTTNYVKGPNQTNATLTINYNNTSANEACGSLPDLSNLHLPKYTLPIPPPEKVRLSQQQTTSLYQSTQTFPINRPNHPKMSNSINSSLSYQSVPSCSTNAQSLSQTTFVSQNPHAGYDFNTTYSQIMDISSKPAPFNNNTTSNLYYFNVSSDHQNNLFNNNTNNVTHLSSQPKSVLGYASYHSSTEDGLNMKNPLIQDCSFSQPLSISMTEVNMGFNAINKTKPIPINNEINDASNPFPSSFDERLHSTYANKMHDLYGGGLTDYRSTSTVELNYRPSENQMYPMKINVSPLLKSTPDTSPQTHSNKPDSNPLTEMLNFDQNNKKLEITGQDNVILSTNESFDDIMFDINVSLPNGDDDNLLSVDDLLENIATSSLQFGPDEQDEILDSQSFNGKNKHLQQTDAINNTNNNKFSKQNKLLNLNQGNNNASTNHFNHIPHIILTEVDSQPDNYLDLTELNMSMDNNVIDDTAFTDDLVDSNNNKITNSVSHKNNPLYDLELLK